MKRIFLLVALGLVFVPGTLFAYTSPGAPSGYVNDFASVLTQEERTTLEATLKDFHQEYGGEVGVVTVLTLGGDAIEDYANTLFREWGIGQKDKNNGVLLVVAIEDRSLRIEVGYGYEGSLTDARSSEIIRNAITPYFKQNAYGLGIMTGVKDIITTVTTGEVPVEHQDTSVGLPTQDTLTTWLFVLFVIFPWIASVFGRSKSWWAGGIAGAAVGSLVSVLFGLASWVYPVIVATIIGLIFDLIVSRGYRSSVASGSRPPWWTGGGGFGGGSSSGGFGGFGGGSSGGGGASGRW
jgi:uncharacterized protein